jgi:hypothetical protein
VPALRPLPVTGAPRLARPAAALAAGVLAVALLAATAVTGPRGRPT